MFEKYRSNCYSPEKVKGRYVRKYSYWDWNKQQLVDGGYMVVETNDRHQSMREYTGAGDEIPETVRIKANKRVGHYPSFVEWPL